MFSKKYDYIYSDISEIKDRDILRLVRELEVLHPQPRSGLLIHFFVQSLYHNSKFTPINEEQINKSNIILVDNAPRTILKEQIKSFTGGELYAMCCELTTYGKMNSIEDYHRTKLFSFLNRALK